MRWRGGPGRGLHVQWRDGGRMVGGRGTRIALADTRVVASAVVLVRFDQTEAR